MKWSATRRPRDRVLLEVRFAFTGSVSPAVRAVVDPGKMSWITRTELLLAEGRSSWTVLPDHYPDRLSASGTYRFEEGGGTRHVRGRGRG